MSIRIDAIPDATREEVRKRELARISKVQARIRADAVVRAEERAKMKLEREEREALEKLDREKFEREAPAELRTGMYNNLL